VTITELHDAVKGAHVIARTATQIIRDRDNRIAELEQQLHDQKTKITNLEMVVDDARGLAKMPCGRCGS
jgi:predicted RNase H-like nuclease (RuvC/YqgF family)